MASSDNPSMFHYEGRNNIVIELRISSDMYYPEEDSILLAKALEAALPALHQALSREHKPETILDMGTGSGFIAILCKKLLPSAAVSASDVAGLEQAKTNAEASSTPITFIKSNLFENIAKSFDAIIFNAPYLPPDSSDELTLQASRSWSGGLTLVKRFINQAAKHLNDNGHIFIVVSSLTGLDDVLAAFSKADLGANVIAREKLDWEELYVIESVRK